MSECVVRMEMPRNCHECPVSYQSFGDTPCWCKLSFEKNEAVSDGLMWREADPQTRPDWCPIICQLPEGHGRLVDADALIGLMLERKQPLVGADNSKDRYRYMQWLADFNAIKDAKTIIPAEKGESKNGVK